MEIMQIINRIKVMSPSCQLLEVTRTSLLKARVHKASQQPSRHPSLLSLLKHLRRLISQARICLEGINQQVILPQQDKLEVFSVTSQRLLVGYLTTQQQPQIRQPYNRTLQMHRQSINPQRAISQVKLHQTLHQTPLPNNQPQIRLQGISSVTKNLLKPPLPPVSQQVMVFSAISQPPQDSKIHLSKANLLRTNRPKIHLLKILQPQDSKVNFNLISGSTGTGVNLFNNTANQPTQNQGQSGNTSNPTGPTFGNQTNPQGSNPVGQPNQPQPQRPTV